MTQIQNPAFQFPASQALLAACLTEPPARPAFTAEVFGTLFFEVTLSQSAPPTLPGWTLRLWPQARLGDATLEARPDRSSNQGTLDDLLAGLAAQGVGVLGPVRQHR